MKIEHIAVYVKDLEASALFLKHIFKVRETASTEMKKLVFLLTLSLLITEQELN